MFTGTKGPQKESPQDQNSTKVPWTSQCELNIRSR